MMGLSTGLCSSFLSVGLLLFWFHECAQSSRQILEEECRSVPTVLLVVDRMIPVSAVMLGTLATTVGKNTSAPSPKVSLHDSNSMGAQAVVWKSETRRNDPV